MRRENPRMVLVRRVSRLLPGLDQATAQSLVETAHTVCPYSNATRNNVDVRLSAA